MLHQNLHLNTFDRDETRPFHVLLCPDEPSWSFDNIANNIARNAGANRVSKLYMRDVIGNEQRFFEAIFLKRIDACHIFWREDLFHLFNPETLYKVASDMGLDREVIVRAINSCAFTTSVYDHLFSEEEEIQERRTGFALADGYTVSSAKLRSIYAAQPNMPAPDAVISDGVDTDHFSPGAGRRRSEHPFAVGWVGNSMWGKQTKGYDVKGFNRLFEPAMAMLSERGHTLQAKVADPRIRRISFQDMPDFYRQLDVFVCTSAIEGTPNPVLEAMACGIPVVSTDVGIVPEVFGEQQTRFIVPRADVAMFADAIAELLGNAALRRTLGQENRRQALQWSWERKTADWWPFWQRAVMRAMDPRNATRREMLLRSIAGVL